jgi:hypothetical protein
MAATASWIGTRKPQNDCGQVGVYRTCPVAMETGTEELRDYFPNPVRT